MENEVTERNDRLEDAKTAHNQVLKENVCFETKCSNILRFKRGSLDQ